MLSLKESFLIILVDSSQEMSDYQVIKGRFTAQGLGSTLISLINSSLEVKCPIDDWFF